jgi:hypothetical protein
LQSLGKFVSQEAIDNFHLTVGSDELKVGHRQELIAAGWLWLAGWRRSIKVNFAILH